MSRYAPLPNFCSAPQNFCYISPPNRRLTGVEYARKNRKTFMTLALSQFFLGLCVVAIGVGLMIMGEDDNERFGHYPYYSDYYDIGCYTKLGNIVTGSMVVVYSIFGLIQAGVPSPCTIITNITMSALGIMSTFIMMGTEIMESILADMSMLLFLHCTASGMYFALFILFIVSCARASRARGCCADCCCCDQNTDQQAVLPPYSVMLPGGQPSIVSQEPIYFGQPPAYGNLVIQFPDDQLDRGMNNPAFHGGEKM